MPMAYVLNLANVICVFCMVQPLYKRVSSYGLMELDPMQL